MSSTQYTISIPTANATIDRVLRVLSATGAKANRSDIKFAIADLLSFDTPRELDLNIKQHEEIDDALSVYDRQGVHKKNPNALFKRFDSAIDAHDFFSNDNERACVYCFEFNNQAESGFEYKHGDFILAETPLDAADVLLNWGENTSLEYCLYEDDERPLHAYEGYWRFRMFGFHLFNALEREQIDFTISNEEFHSPDCDRRELEEFIFEGLVEEHEFPFERYTPEQREEHISSMLIEEYDVARG